MTVSTETHYFVCVGCTNCRFGEQRPGISRGQKVVRTIPKGTTVPEWLAQDHNSVCPDCGCKTLVRVT
jgi:hypothetical protein